MKITQTGNQPVITIKGSRQVSGGAYIAGMGLIFAFIAFISIIGGEGAAAWAGGLIGLLAVASGKYLIFSAAGRRITMVKGGTTTIVTTGLLMAINNRKFFGQLIS